jgi:hypothetical protein
MIVDLCPNSVRQSTYLRISSRLQIAPLRECTEKNEGQSRLSDYSAHSTKQANHLHLASEMT